MSVSLNHIQAANAKLAQIAFARGQDSDPAETLVLWRASEGFEQDALEQAARESAAETVEEIRALTEQRQVSLETLVEFFERDFMHAFDLGFVVRARAEARAKEKAVDAD